MNRSEFMKKLEELLANISKEEREEALQYYNDYFEDAGPEHEADVIRELESPEKVAATIKADMNDTDHAENKGKTSRKEWCSGSPGKIAIVVVLCIICAPIVIPVGIALVMTIFALIVAAFSVFAGLVVAAASIGIAGVLAVITGFPLLMVAFPTGILSIGSGLILGVVGVIGVVAAVKLCTIVYPAMVRFVKNVYHKIFHRVN